MDIIRKGCVHKKAAEFGDEWGKLPFMVRDIFGVVEDEEIFEIQNLYVSPEARGRGIGETLLKHTVDIHNDKIICCATGLSMKDFPEEPTKAQQDEVLKNLNAFYTGVGFCSINDFVGYETQEAFVYLNDKGKALVAKIKEVMEEHKKEIAAKTNSLTPSSVFES